MRVAVLALDSVFDLGLSAVLDALGTANELNELFGLGVEPFEVQVVGLRSRVKSAQGLQVPVVPVSESAPDCVVVPALGFKMPEPLQAALAKPEIQQSKLVLRHWAEAGATMTAACIGTFVLAESGLLDNRPATTTWWLATLFRSRYPKVILRQSEMIVKSDRFVTAGAALSHMDLALWLVRATSPQLASLTAKYLIVDSRPSQSAYAIVDHLAHQDSIVQGFESWVRPRLKDRISLDEAVRAIGTSKRTLARRTQSVLGMSPHSYVKALRVQHAVHLLRTGEASVDEVAEQVGYAGGASLRTVLRQRLNLGVKDIRKAARE